MRAVVHFLVLGVALGGLALGGEPASASMDGTSKANPEEVWEKVIAAKGGRGRLHAVKSVLVSVRRTGWWEGKRGRWRGDTLYVFPNKMWYWDDEGPLPMGISVGMYNGDADAEWNQHEGYPVEKNGPPTRPQVKLDLIDFQIIYLLETKWLKPSLLSVREEKRGWSKVYVLRGAADPYEIDYVIDAKTFLPKEIILYREYSGSIPELLRGRMKEKEIMTIPYKIHHYIEVQGVMMPGAISGYEWRGKNRPTYQFNVEYDPRLFDRPPSLADGPEGWRANKAQ